MHILPKVLGLTLALVFPCPYPLDWESNVYVIVVRKTSFASVRVILVLDTNFLKHGLLYP